LGGAFFLAPPGKTLAKQLAVERRVYAPLNDKLTCAQELSVYYTLSSCASSAAIC